MKKRLLLFVGLCALLLSACTELENEFNIDRESGGAISFNLFIPGSALNTYASVEAIGGEDQVHTLYVLFFEPSVDGSGKFLEMHDISPSNGGYYRSGQTVEIDLEPGSAIVKANPYSLLFMANPGTHIENINVWKETLAGKTEAEVKELRVGVEGNPSIAGSAGYYNYDAYIQSNLMMSGSVNKEGGQDLVVVELTRLVSRFDVVNKAGSAYELVSASVWNGFPDENIWDNKYSDFSKTRIKRLYGMSVTTDNVTGGLYAYENFVTKPEADDEVTTCLILGIKNAGKVSYYRVNAAQSTGAQQLKRNNVYTFNILSVKGPGKDSEEDAYKSTDRLLNVQINEWNVDDQGNIQIDGDNILAISTTNIHFTPEGGSREYTVFAIGEGVLYMSKKELPTGFTAELDGNLLKVTATSSEVDKAGYVELQFGKLSVVVNITQSGEKELFLELSHQTLPMFSGEGTEISEAVTVTSSGSWKAQIYNDLGTFRFGTGELDANGDNLTQFTIKTIQDNSEINNRYAFVLVTLDEDPDIARVVLVSQNGLGQLDIDPEGDLRFTANGQTIDDPTYPDKYVINVDTENDREWEYSLYGLNPGYFTVNRVGETLEIIPNGINPEDAELTMQVRIYLEDNPTIRKEFTVTQQKHILELNPTTVGLVATEGGTSDAVTVTATGNWTATIASTGNTATFYSTGNSTMTGTSDGDDFRVVFPELTQGNVYPQATITVRLDGTNITRTIVISQREMQGRVIRMQNAETWYGYLTDDNTSLYRTNYIEQLYQSLVNSANFSTVGKLFCGGVDFLTVGRVPNDMTDIYVSNSFNGTAAQAADIMTWLNGSSNRVLVLLQDDRTNTMLSYLGLDKYNYAGTGGTGNNIFPTNFARTLNTGSEYTVDNNELYKYLLKDGPFTVGGPVIAKDQVKLMPYDASNNCLTKWPSTMIPLMLVENDPNRLILGVDPTLRIVYLGEMDILTQVGTSTIYYVEDGVRYTAANNYANGPYAETNAKFVNNLLAWMMEVVISGDSFTNQFK